VSNRTVIALVAIAAALFAFIYFYDRDRMTTGELEGRKDRVFVEFKPDAVDAIEIRGSSGERIALAREARAAGAAIEDAWRIEAPQKLRADGAAVRELLSALDFLVKRRVVVGAGERDKPQYGLKVPAISVSFTIRGAKTSFGIGSGKGSGDTIYVAVDGRPDELYAVEKEFRDSMDKKLDDLRDKHLIAEALDGAVGIEVARSGEPLSLSRTDGRGPWRMARGGAQMLAADDQAAAILADLGNLRAEEFVADGAAEKELARYGLDAPNYRVSVRLPAGKTTGLLVGKACPSAGRVYATVQGSGTVACVADGIAATLGRPAARFAETRPFVFADDEIEKIAVSKGGASIAFARDPEKGWVATGSKDVAIDPGAVADLLEALKETRAREVIAGADAVAGLGAPAATVELVKEAGGGSLKLDVFAADPKAASGGQRARRVGEDGVLVFDADLLAALPADLLAYRERKIANGLADDVVAIQIEGPAAQKLERKDGVWRLVAPLAVDADATAARGAAQLVAEVDVDKYAAERAEPAHGFAAPYAKISARFSKPPAAAKDAGPKDGEKSVTLEIGAPAAPDGSRFARLAGGDGLVFVLKKEKIDLVTVPLVARDLLAVEATDLVKIGLTAKGATLTATREGETWKAEGGAADSGQLGRLFGELGTIRTIRGASFGPAAGLEAPALKIEAWTQKQLDEKAAPTVLVFGAKLADPKEDGYTARKEGVAVTVIVPSRLVDDLIAIVPAAPPAPSPAP
jgi:hypothetical protein